MALSLTPLVAGRDNTLLLGVLSSLLVNFDL